LQFKLIFFYAFIQFLAFAPHEYVEVFIFFILSFYAYYFLLLQYTLFLHFSD
jgi:hypothetical protein